MIKIGNKNIGEDSQVFIVAEISANHNQDFEIAVRTIEEIKRTGADAVKLQTYTADTITINSDKRYFQIRQGTLWDGESLYNLYQKAYTPWEWQPKLKKIAESLGLECFSSPFDRTAVDFLEKMNVPAYKVASPEIVDIPLIEYIASKGKPIIMSTGVALEEDIYEAVRSCRKMNNNQLALLKCSTAYPAPLDEANLNMIPDMKKRFETIVGYSDHTLGIIAPIAAVAIGAKIIEKHFILDKSLGGPDAAFSMDAEDFKTMVKGIRDTEKTLGNIDYNLTETAKRNRKFARSLFVIKNMKLGEVFTEENIRSIRPSDGLPPKYYKEILGKKAAKDIEEGTPLSWELVN
jgi:pseudaminic acid synthase